MHARNLFHASIVMYDSWMAYEPSGNTYLLGKTLGEFESSFEGVNLPEDIQLAREETISYAMYRLIEHRYAQSPGIIEISDSIQSYMSNHGYDILLESTDYVNGGPAELGNYIASQVIAFGYTDGANEAGNYGNLYYEPLNPPIAVEEPGNPEIIDPNRWQQISLSLSIDQSGEEVESTPPFLSPEWGDVLPFSMTAEDRVVKSRDGHDYTIYKDPGFPALIDTTNPLGLESFYKWNFILVGLWQSHLDTSDNVVWDISPKSIGNIQEYPETQEEFHAFYDLLEGGDPGEGYDLNPVTEQPYQPQLIRRGDYARVLAEFWADGPNSVTPPGHWFYIYNHISDHPLFENFWMGEGDELDQLEYDIKAYFSIGGAMHDAAITSWSIKGYYDFIRPVSAIRYMGDKGQCTDPGLPHYHPAGLPIIPGHIELVEIGDPLAGLANQHAGKMKIYTWRGPDYIDDPLTDDAGVGWILVENWWPYQRPSFVTPPFAGYVSGHSTYSRTAAEVLTLMTGSEYFPGGMSGFQVEQNEFLVFEDGPSESFELQWAKYRDASDQCSLSRIWGGIHPPIDDIPGRKIGIELGPQAFNHANEIIQSSRPFVTEIESSSIEINQSDIGNAISISVYFNQEMDQTIDPQIHFHDASILNVLNQTAATWASSSKYTLSYLIEDYLIENISSSFTVSGAVNLSGMVQNPYLQADMLQIDTQLPLVTNLVYSSQTLNDQIAESGNFSIEISFSEECDTLLSPAITFNSSVDLASSFVWLDAESHWNDESSYIAVYSLLDNDIEANDISLQVGSVTDLIGNSLNPFTSETGFILDTKNPSLEVAEVNDEMVNIQDIGTLDLSILLEFDNSMNTSIQPVLIFEGEDPSQTVLNYNSISIVWLSDSVCQIHYSIENTSVEFDEIIFSLQNFQDANGNSSLSENVSSLFSIDTKRPELINASPLVSIVSELNVNGGFYIDLEFSEAMDVNQAVLAIPEGTNVAASLNNDFITSEWISQTVFRAYYHVVDLNTVIDQINLSVNFALDEAGNVQNLSITDNLFSLDTQNPQILSVSSSDYIIEQQDIGTESFEIIVIFQEEMDIENHPIVDFSSAEPVNDIIVTNLNNSVWLNPFTYKFSMDVDNVEVYIPNIDMNLSHAFDIAGNALEMGVFTDFLILNTLSLGISESGSIEGVNIYPTILSQGQNLNISSAKTFVNFQFKLFDSTGKTLVSKNQSSLNQGTNIVEINSFGSGIYIYELLAENQIMRGKLVIR